MKRCLFGVSLLLVIAFLFTIPAAADNLYASIKGIATDPTGAVVAGVKLTAVNTATGLTYAVTSNKDGLFSFLQLPIGNYNVKAEQAGFKTFQASGIHLNLDDIYNLEVKLAVGAVSEELIVEANPVQVQQTDMQLGTTVEGQSIVDMPLNGRNWTQLQQLEPGIIYSSDRFGGNNGGYSGNGAETQQNSFLINGVDSNDSALNTVLLVPSPDAIGEFRLVTSTLNPEFGRNSGTIINANIKNGTNSFHGSGFEFYRDTFLDAKNYFEKTASPFHQNEFGGTVGGPIIRDRAFFFFSYQGYRQRIPQDPAYSVTTLSTNQYTNGIWGGGAFDQPLSCDGTDPCQPGPIGLSPVPLATSDANAQTVTGAPCTGGICPTGTPYGLYYGTPGSSPAGCTTTTCPVVSNGMWSSGNVPVSNYNALAQKLVNQFVPVNTLGTTEVSPVTTAHDHQLLGRIDFHVTNSDQVWFYGLWETHPSQDSLPFTGTNLLGLPEQAQRHFQQYAFSWTHTFSPTTLNELRLGYTRFNFAAVEPVSPINPTTYGFTGITPQSLAGASLPKIVTPNFTLGFSNNGPQPRIQNVYQIIDNFSKVWGHHTFKAGVSLNKPSIDNPFYSSLNGNFSFNGTGPNSTDNGTMDFLLGYPSGYAQGSGSIVVAKAHEIYAYVQDQWQLRPSLTITYGTGYEVFTPWKNNYDRGLIMGAFHPGVQSVVFPTAPQGYVYPGDPGMTQYGGPSVRYGLLAPRFGFAWSPTASRNWSVHGGIGLYYNRSEEELALQTLTNPPFAITSAGVVGGSTVGGVACSPGLANPYAHIDGSTCFLGANQINNPFPFTPPAAGATNINFSQFAPVGLGFTGMDTRFTAPRSTNFNLTVERQLDKATILSVAYVGNRGRHEEGAIDLNLAGQAPGVNPAAAAAGCPFGYLMAFPGFCPEANYSQDPTTFVYTPLGATPGSTPYYLPVWGHPGEELTEFNSKYDSMQVTLNRRFSKGLQVLAAYTWSRYFDQTSSLEGSAFNFPGINQFCTKCNWAPSDNDAPQRFVISYTYTLPIYSLTHKWKRLTDDWNISGIYTLQHGTPVAVFDPLSFSDLYSVNDSFFAGPGQAVRTSAPLGIRNPRNNDGSNPDNLYFNPAAFSIVNTGELGTASRNPIHGPGVNYGDLALEKRIHIDEARYFELRFETYNTFNHVNFANPTDPGFFNNEDVTNSFGNFGQVYSTKTISTGGEGRAVQLGIKFYF